ncbi:MAG: RluA family pseudouridine synthase [Bacteroidetes bacterium]|nr:RluA family pseudouridine synthase [Bacteroidota bacterium]
MSTTPFNRQKSKVTQLTVTKSARLMEFLIEQLKGKSRTTIKSLLAHRQVSVGAHTITQFDFPLEPNQFVTINWGVVPEQTRLRGVRILFEDPYLIVIDKEAGMLSIATAKEKLLTTYSILSSHVKKEDPNNRIFVVHRLDRDTSGVMMFAKSEKVQEIMQKDWQEAVIRRSYIAVVEGIVEKDKDTIRSFLKENKMLFMYSTKVPGEGDEAITHYKVLKRSEEFTLLEVELETGRKNQIRVHMKELGHPVAGDKKYGSKLNPLRRTCLHANILAFKHPITGEELSFETPPPHRFLTLFS